MEWLLADLVEVLSTFGRVATADPVSAVLLLGSVLVLGTVFGVVGVLGLGAIANLLTGWP
ncbi:MAG: hypothetical protein ABEJ84_08745 [Halodesulfurarchaeum sp.]